jgi:hypothetical protein
MRILKKLWKLPTPKELGWSDSNALPSRDFSPNAIGKTWEDWDEKVKTDYPVRYFLVEQLHPWLLRKYHRLVKDPIYYLKCHLFPKHKYHLIDIREPNGYRFGWIDADHKMILALFTILNDFVKNEMSQKYCPSEEEVHTDPHLLKQRNAYLEIKVIHYWWNIERLRQEKAHDDLLSAWSGAKHSQATTVHQLWDDLQKIQEANEAKTEEMIERLLKIRHHLWT